MCSVPAVNVSQVRFDSLVYFFKFAGNANIIIVIPIQKILTVVVFGYVISILVYKSIKVVNVEQHAYNI